ncbi:MAG: hypothetical protein D6798_09780, partial [Deltaproteobacteria bacterium]
FDEHTGLPLSAWGPPIALGSLESGAQVEAALVAFLSRHPDLVGVPLDQLALQTIARDEGRDAWTVQLVQVAPAGFDLADPRVRGDHPLDPDAVLDPYGTGGGLVDDQPSFAPLLAAEGVAVEGAVARFRVVSDRLVWFSARTRPQASEPVGAPALSAADAVAVVQADGPVPEVEHALVGTRLLVMPLDLLGAGFQDRLVYEVRTRTTTPAGLWVSYVDAGTGRFLAAHNLVRYVSGTVTGTHDTRTVDGDFSDSPLVELRLTGDVDGDTTTTDATDGSYDLPDSSTVSAALSGTMVQVYNQSGAEAAVSFSGDFLWTDEDATQAEIDSYVFINQVYDWKDAHAPEVTYNRIRSNVNINSSCNAYFDGSVNFYKAGGSCNNTGRIADVEYHEWGHGFHYYSLESGSFDGSVSEGIGDFVAALQTGDYRIGPYFYTSGGYIRELETDRSYPDDVTGEVHSDGLIYAGAMWDLWQRLVSDLGEEEGYAVTSRIFKDMIKLGPDIAESYDAAILADDDNGDLSDGTPHQCAIIESFAAHGLGPSGGGSLLALSHEPLANQPPGASGYPVAADLLNLAPDCLDFEVSSAVVRYSVDGGVTWEEAPLTAGSDAVEGSIPAQPAGTIVQYYIEADTPDGSQVSVPSGRFINPFTFVVGDLVELYCEDFESDDGGYEHALLEGVDQVGADDWIWASPAGYADDPTEAASGVYVWGNDLGGGNYNGEYQPDKHNRLWTPPIDVSGYDTVFLQYNRWLAVEDGYWDTAQVVQLDDPESVDDYLVLWENYASPGGRSVDHSEHTRDEQWTPHTLQVEVPETGQLRVGWDIISDAGLEMGGWNIDDVCVYALLDTPVGDTGGDTGGPAGDGGASGGDGGSADGGVDTGVTGSDTGGSASVDGGSAADDGEWAVEPAGGCACSHAAPTRPAWWSIGALLVGLVGVRRRR